MAWRDAVIGLIYSGRYGPLEWWDFVQGFTCILFGCQRLVQAILVLTRLSKVALLSQFLSFLVRLLRAPLSLLSRPLSLLLSGFRLSPVFYFVYVRTKRYHFTLRPVQAFLPSLWPRLDLVLGLSPFGCFCFGCLGNWLLLFLSDTNSMYELNTGRIEPQYRYMFGTVNK